MDHSLLIGIICSNNIINEDMTKPEEEKTIVYYSLNNDSVKLSVCNKIYSKVYF